MSSWLQTPLGEYLIAWEQARLDGMLADIFGYNALQVGLGQVDLLRASRMPLHACTARAAQDDASSVPSRLTVVCDEAALPFAGASLDLWCLPINSNFPPHRINSCARPLACWWAKAAW
jgi:hypothetical protein